LVITYLFLLAGEFMIRTFLYVSGMDGYIYRGNFIRLQQLSWEVGSWLYLGFACMWVKPALFCLGSYWGLCVCGWNPHCFVWGHTQCFGLCVHLLFIFGVVYV